MPLIPTRESEATTFEVIPAGTYDAQLKKVDEVPRKNPKPDDSPNMLIWRYEVTGKSGRTAEVVGFSDLSIGSGSHAFAWAGFLRGKEYTPGEPINTDDLIGKPCQLLVSVQKNTNGREGSRNKIEAVLAPPLAGEPLF